VTVRLAGAAVQQWADFDGWAVSRNIPPVGTLPIARFCNLVWYWLTYRAESEKDVSKIRNTLWRPPPGHVPTKGPWSPEEETSAFQSLRKALKK